MILEQFKLEPQTHPGTLQYCGEIPPRQATIGFTDGIAILIASTQIKQFFGLHTEHVASAFLPRMRLLFHILQNRL